MIELPITTSDGYLIKRKNSPLSLYLCSSLYPAFASMENVKFHNFDPAKEKYAELTPFTYTDLFSKEEYLMNKDNAWLLSFSDYSGIRYGDYNVVMYNDFIFSPPETQCSVTISRLRVFSTVFTNLNLNFQWREDIPGLMPGIFATPDICSIRLDQVGNNAVRAYVNGVDQGTWFLDSYPYHIPPTQ